MIGWRAGCVVHRWCSSFKDALAVDLLSASSRTTFNSRANWAGSNFTCCMASAISPMAAARSCGAVDEVRRQVGRCGGVRGPAEGVDDLLDLFFGSMRRAAAGHDVLQHVAQPGPKVLTLVGAARVFDETPHRGDWDRVVLLHDHRQAVGKRGQSDGFRKPEKTGVAGRFHLGSRRDRKLQYSQQPAGQRRLYPDSHKLFPFVWPRHPRQGSNHSTHSPFHG